MLIEAASGEVSKEPDWVKQKFSYQSDTTPMVLYKLSSDMKENKNLYSDYPEKVNELKTLLEKSGKEGRSAPFIR